MYDILAFLNFLYLPQIMQQIFFICTILEYMKKFLVIVYHYCTFYIKSINPTQKYPHMIESYAYIL